MIAEARAGAIHLGRVLQGQRGLGELVQALLHGVEAGGALKLLSPTSD